MRRALSTRSSAERTHAGAVFLRSPVSYTAMRRAEGIFEYRRSRT
jgi:hypothetical protein